ncbi:Leucine rich repeat-containing protein [Aquimarina amphilecti]|uniref:Leucine rich repeat-containing protein n=1 Tax=Aquimarina amphilecti TaxID=1038014 RepID=A0A1H7TPR1_AQUAM|nr:leucine-rich repeat domain-containing protein [Aquimarina amphilecti]SEL86852.1 Leucine rich repeat-containing protein [Aquimarina amphilecti]
MKLYIKQTVFLIIITSIISCAKGDDGPIEEASKSNEKQITSFVFLLTNNPIDVNVVATIDEENKTITATMPEGTPITGLLPKIEVSALAIIDRTTAEDFTQALEYKVTAEDGSEVIYTVTVTALLSQRQILQAILDANPDNTLGWDLNATENLGDLNGITLNTEGEIIGFFANVVNVSIIPAEIGQLTKLEELFFIANKIQSIPPEIGLLTNLRKLYLNSSHQLNVIPEEIGQLTNLTSLSLNSNKLTSIPVEIGQLTNLTFLSLVSNQLTSLPIEIGQLTNLITLRLSSNQLTSLPVEIGQLSNLEILNINRNELTTLPIEIEQLTSLEILDLGENQLTSLSKEIGQLIRLKELSLFRNQFISLPPEIGFLSQLEKLFINNNNLTEIPASILQLELHNDLLVVKDPEVNYDSQSSNDLLIEIYSANPGNTLEWSVDEYPGVTFGDTGGVIEITMNNKNLTRIPSNVFKLGGLKVLNINNNKFETLDANLGEIGSLEVITAASNNLTTVPDTFRKLENLTLLSLIDNPITSIPPEVCNLQTSNGGILTLLTDPGEGCN